MNEATPCGPEDRRRVVTVVLVLVLGAVLILVQGLMIHWHGARGYGRPLIVSLPAAVLWEGGLKDAEEALIALGGFAAVAATTWLALTPVVSRPSFARVFLPIGLILAACASTLFWWHSFGALGRSFGRSIAYGAVVVQVLCLMLFISLHLRWHRSPDGTASRAYAILLQAWLQTTCMPMPWGWI